MAFSIKSGRTNKQRIVSTLVLSVILIFFIVLIPYFLGFARTGFSDPSVFQQYMVYAYFAGLMLFGILILYFVEILIKEKDKMYGDGVGFNNQGDYPSLKFFGKYSTFQIALAAFIIMTILAFVNFLTVQQSFFQIGITQQQFTSTDALAYRTFLVPASENLGFAFMIALFLFLLRMFCRKNKVTKQNFFVYSIIGVVVLSAIYGYGVHQLVYSGQETNLLRVIMIWTVGGIVTLLTGNFVVFWAIHLVNNLFIDLKGLFPNEMVIVVFSMMIFSLIAFYWYLYIRKKKGGFKDFNIQ